VIAVDRDCADVRAGAQVDAVLAVQSGEDLTQFRAQGRFERKAGMFEHGDVDVETASRRGNFETDPAGTDHD